MSDVALGNVSVIAMITDPDTGLRTKHKYSNITQSTTNMHIPADRDLFETLRDAVNLWRVMCLAISESRQGPHDCSMFLRHREQTSYRLRDRNSS